MPPHIHPTLSNNTRNSPFNNPERHARSIPHTGSVLNLDGSEQWYKPQSCDTTSSDSGSRDHPIEPAAASSPPSLSDPSLTTIELLHGKGVSINLTISDHRNHVRLGHLSRHPRHLLPPRRRYVPPLHQDDPSLTPLSMDQSRSLHRRLDHQPRPLLSGLRPRPSPRLVHNP